LELIRIDNTGATEVISFPNLSPDLEYFAGAVSPSGNRLTVLGRSKETPKVDISIHTINLANPSQSGLLSVVGINDVAVEDFAYDPVFGLIYGFDKEKNSVVAIGQSGDVTNYQFEVASNVQSIGSVFYDKTGQLYGVGNMSGSSAVQLIALNKFTGEATPVSSFQSSFFQDGCACPYTFSFDKWFETPVVSTCSFVKLHYRINNTAGIPYYHLAIQDSLPPGLIFESIEPHSLGELEISGLGTNKITIDEVFLLLGETELTLNVYVEEGIEGNIETQAFIEKLPFVFDKIASNEPVTEQENDASILLVESPVVGRETSQILLCEEELKTVLPPYPNLQYTWNDNSQNDFLVVDESGTYWVENTSDCITFTDTFVVSIAPQNPSFNIDAPEEITIGIPWQTILDYSAEEPASFLWELEYGALSCNDCPTPSLSLTQDDWLKLTITDANECVTKDSVLLKAITAETWAIASAFSPNNDGLNDGFSLGFNETSIQSLNLKIFNRWGQLVFQTTSTNQAWLGTNANGKRQPIGTYIWVADIVWSNGTPQQLMGDVLLVR